MYAAGQKSSVLKISLLKCRPLPQPKRRITSVDTGLKVGELFDSEHGKVLVILKRGQNLRKTKGMSLNTRCRCLTLCLYLAVLTTFHLSASI